MKSLFSSLVRSLGILWIALSAASQADAQERINKGGGGGGRGSARQSFQGALSLQEQRKAVEQFENAWKMASLLFATEAKNAGLAVPQNQAFPCGGYIEASLSLFDASASVGQGIHSYRECRGLSFPSDLKVIPTQEKLFYPGDSEEKYAITDREKKEIRLNVDQWNQIMAEEAHLAPAYAAHEYFVYEGLESNRVYDFSKELSVVQDQDRMVQGMHRWDRSYMSPDAVERVTRRLGRVR